MQDVIPEFSKKIQLKINIEKVTDEIIKGINEVFDKYQGKVPIEILLIDYDQNINLKAQSKSKRLDINAELLSQLQQLDLKYKLN